MYRATDGEYLGRTEFKIDAILTRFQEMMPSETNDYVLSSNPAPCRSSAKQLLQVEMVHEIHTRIMRAETNPTLA